MVHDEWFTIYDSWLMVHGERQVQGSRRLLVHGSGFTVNDPLLVHVSRTEKNKKYE